MLRRAIHAEAAVKARDWVLGRRHQHGRGAENMRTLISYVCSVIGSFTLGVAVFIALMRTGDCSLGAVAKGIFFGFPVGGVMGIFMFRVFSRRFRKIDMVSIVVGWVVSTAAAVVALLATDRFLGILAGIPFAVLLCSLCALVGYMVVDATASRLHRTD